MTTQAQGKRFTNVAFPLGSFRGSTKRQRCQQLPSGKNSSSRRSYSLEEIMKINEQGIQSFRKGNMEDAEKHFSEALTRMREAKGLCLPLVANSHSDPAMTDHIHGSIAAGLFESHGSRQNQKCQQDSEAGCVVRASKYDEGMYVFRDPQDFDLAMLENHRKHNNETPEAILSFNLGQVNIRLGKYADATTRFQAALEYLKHEGEYRKIQVYHNLGYCSYCLGNYTEAEGFFLQAMDGIQESPGHDEICKAATSNCLGVVLMYNSPRQDDNDRSLLLDLAFDHLQDSLIFYRKVFDAKQLSKRVGQVAKDASKTIATVLNNLGRVCYLQGKLEDAIAAYKEALQIRANLATCSTSNDLFATLCNLGQTLHAQENLYDALEYYQTAWTMVQQHSCFAKECVKQCLYNPRDVLFVTDSIADIHHELGKIEEAIAMYALAVQLSRRINTTMPTSCLQLATLLNKLGTVCFSAGRVEDALECFGESLGLEQVLLGLHHPRTIVTMTNIAHVHRQRHDYMQAYVQYDNVRNLQIEAMGSNHIDVAQTLIQMALMKYHLTMYNTAFRLYQDALRIQRDHYGTDDRMEIASTLNSIGIVLFQLKDDPICEYSDGWYKQMAKTVFMESLQIRRNLLGQDHPDVAISCYNLATICTDMGDDELSIRLYREALRIERMQSSKSQASDREGNDMVSTYCRNDVIVTLQQLGLVHQQRGELDEALECFKEALELERQKLKPDEVNSGTTTNRDACDELFQNQLVVGKLLNLIGNLQLQQADIDGMMVSFTEASRLFVAYNRSQRESESSTSTSATLLIAGYNFYALSQMNPSCAAVA